MSRSPVGLRSGYTTGTCAAAAAKAATLALLSQAVINDVEVSLPDGQRAGFDLHMCEFSEYEATCSVIKDAGDDPDITNGAEICASVNWTDKSGIVVEGGKGVGQVTKPGLDVPVGEPAINKVPQTMITQNVREVLTNGKGMRVTVSVPEGEKLAKKTLNKRLGIIGGISILGTTGIVIPYSVDAYEASISQALDIAVASGCLAVVLTTGRRSEKYAQKQFSLPEEAFILMGDFVGHALKECALKNIEKVILWGMIGKLSKIAEGNFYTNITDSKINIDFLAQVAESCGVKEPVRSRSRKAITAHHFLEIVGEEWKKDICDRVCFLAAQICREHAGSAFKAECIMSTYDGELLGRAYVEA